MCSWAESRLLRPRLSPTANKKGRLPHLSAPGPKRRGGGYLWPRCGQRLALGWEADWAALGCWWVVEGIWPRWPTKGAMAALPYVLGGSASQETDRKCERERE